MRNTIRARVANLLCTRLLISRKRLSFSQRLQEDCHLSAYDCLEMALLLEIEFQLDLCDQEVAALRTFGHVVQCVTQHLQIAAR